MKRLKHRRKAAPLAAGLISVFLFAPPVLGQSWDYALKPDEKGQPHAVYARIFGDDGSHLWLVCTKYSSGGRGVAVSLTATVFQERFLGPSDLNGRSAVYWFDDARPDASRWAYRDRYAQLSDATRVEAFLERLIEAKKLVVELSNYRLETSASEFRLDPAQSRATIERFRRDCSELSNKQA